MSTSTLTRVSLAILIIGFLVMFVGGGSRFAIGLVLKPMVQDLSWTRSTVGGAAALFLAVSASCMFLSGRLADKFSLRLLLSGGLVIAAIGIGLMSVVQAPWQAWLFYGFIFAIGNGIASIAPVGVMVTRMFPGRTGLANAITTSGIGVGQLLLIGGLATFLVDSSWRNSFLWLAVINLIMIPVVLAGIRSHGQTEDNKTIQPPAAEGLLLAGAARTRQFWLLMVVYAICGFQDFFVATHVVAFAQDRGVDSLLAGNLLALMGLAGVGGVFLAGIWSDRSGPRAPTLFCFVLRLALFGWILIDQSLPSVAVFGLSFGITMWLTAPILVVFVRNAFGSAHLGSISGLIVMVHHMSGGLGALVGANVFDVRGDYGAMFVSMLVLSVIAFVLTAMLKR